MDPALLVGDAEADRVAPALGVGVAHLAGGAAAHGLAAVAEVPLARGERADGAAAVHDHGLSGAGLVGQGDHRLGAVRAPGGERRRHAEAVGAHAAERHARGEVAGAVASVVEHLAAVVVRRHHVQVAIAVEVAGVKGPVAPLIEVGDVDGVLEGQIAVAPVEPDVAVAAVVGDDVDVAVLVEVPGGHAVGIRAGVANADLIPEGAVAVAGVHVDVAAAVAAPDQIQATVVVEVGEIHASA